MSVERSISEANELLKTVQSLCEKLGFAAALFLLLSMFLAGFIVYLVHAHIQSLRLQLKSINAENKRYQDFFIKTRRSSGQRLLGEKAKKKQPAKNVDSKVVRIDGKSTE